MAAAAATIHVGTEIVGVEAGAGAKGRDDVESGNVVIFAADVVWVAVELVEEEVPGGEVDLKALVEGDGV